VNLEKKEELTRNIIAEEVTNARFGQEAIKHPKEMLKEEETGNPETNSESLAREGRAIITDINHYYHPQK